MNRRRDSTQVRHNAQVGAGYNSSGLAKLRGGPGTRTRKVGLSIEGHHSRSRCWWIAIIVLGSFTLLFGIGTFAVSIIDVELQKDIKDHVDWKLDETCDDGKQCSLDLSRKFSGELACDHKPVPPGTECESVCYEGNDHVCVDTSDDCDDCMECQGSTCMGDCDDDDDCPDIYFTTGGIWYLADFLSEGAFGFNKFCYAGMCLYEHDSAVLPLLPTSQAFECTSSPAALAFASGLIVPSDNLSECLVPSVACRGQFDDQIRVDVVFHTFACSNASLPLFQFAGNTP